MTQMTQMKYYKSADGAGLWLAPVEIRQVNSVSSAKSAIPIGDSYSRWSASVKRRLGLFSTRIAQKSW